MTRPDYNHPEITQTDKITVACDGGDSLGHPRVYLHIKEQDNSVECPYCDKKFVFNGDKVHH